MNLIAIITITVMFMMTSYTIYLVQREKNKLSSQAGMMISMAVAVMPGILSGFLIGTYSGDMFLSSGVSMLIGFTIGFAVGQPFGLAAILNGALPGLISGLLGAILGVMLQFTTPWIMICILLALYVVILALVIIFIKVETNEKLTLDTRGISPFAVLAAGVAMITLFLFLYSSNIVKLQGNNASGNNSKPATTQTTTKTEVDVTKESAPKIMMKVTPTGYTPNVIRVKKGIPVELEINNPLEDSCLSTFMMPDFNLNNVNLKVGTTKLSFTPDKTGQFTFSCGMKMFKGTVIVE